MRDQDLQRSGARLNIEIKARCDDHGRTRQILSEMGSRVMGTDHQIDTYFRVPDGRLKLREGSIENSLIFYQRPDQAGPKRSDVQLYRVTPPDPSLKAVLGEALGVFVVVDKEREIHFVDNVKIHLDHVEGLGAFLEIEAIDADGTHSEDSLLAQCEEFMRRFGVRDSDLLDVSYSDLILEQTSP